MQRRFVFTCLELLLAAVAKRKSIKSNASQFEI